MFSTWLEWLLVGLLAVWFAATMAFQVFLKQMRPLAKRVDPFGLLVSWRLFSAFPQHLPLWYRDENRDGTFEPWREVPILRSSRWYRTFWNPEIFKPHAIWWFSVPFALQIPKLPHEPLPDNRITQTFWRIVLSQSRSANAIRRQFQMRHVPHTEPRSERVIFTSEFRPLPGTEPET